jgi:cob(I)alamin adenosyltransferase
MAKIYTKTGDGGDTALVGGQRVLKNDIRIDAYGTLDELNCFIGAARCELDAVGNILEKNLDSQLERIQNLLFNLGSLLACEASEREQFKLPQISAGDIEWLEASIDETSAMLKPIKQFILPMGSKLSVQLHIARSVTRRVERLMITDRDSLPAQALPFINRLSDYLFVMARLGNLTRGQEDVFWSK